MQDSKGKYTITKPLGRGGMGQVWAALKHGDGGMQMPCAIKVLWPALAMTDEERERFYGEARIAAQLDHGRIVKVIDTTVMQGSPSLIMEWVDGVNLRVLLDKARAKETPRVGVNVAVYIVGEILAALAYAHGRTVAGEDAAVIHSDVTPGNILISSSGEVKLTDFGIARFVRTSDKTMSHAIGTPRYMSAEQMRGRIYPATDIYGLGVVLHELLEGERYLAELNSQDFQYSVLGGGIPPLTVEVPDWVDALRRRMLSADHEQRPRAEDAHAMIVELSNNYARAGLELKRLYLRCVGSACSGFTELLNLRHGGDTDNFFDSVFGRGEALPSRPDSEAATSTEVDADADAPAALRRPGRPRSGMSTIDHTRTRDPMWVGGDDDPRGSEVLGEGPEVEPTAILPSIPCIPSIPEPAPNADRAPRLALAVVRRSDSDVTPAPHRHLESPFDRGETTLTAVNLRRGDSTRSNSRVDDPGSRQRGFRLRAVAISAGVVAFLCAGVFFTVLAATLSGSDEGRATADEGADAPEPALAVASTPAPDRSAAPEQLVAVTPTQPAEPLAQPSMEVAPPVPGPEPEPESSPDPGPPADTPAAHVDNREPVPNPASAEAHKPATKSKKVSTEPPVTVTFLISGAAKPAQPAQIRANSKRLSTSNGFKSTKLEPGSYRIKWRWGDAGEWHDMRTLVVAADLPAGTYYAVTLDTDDMVVKQNSGGR